MEQASLLDLEDMEELLLLRQLRWNDMIMILSILMIMILSRRVSQLRRMGVSDSSRIDENYC